MKDNPKFIFSKFNYILMAIGVAIILLGFILMATTGETTRTEFNPQTFDFQRITLAPILVISGFVIELYAIFKK